MKMPVHKLLVARRAVQVAVVMTMLLVPAVARYHNYVAAREIDDIIENWRGSIPGSLVAGFDTVLRALPGGEIERAGKQQRNRKQILVYSQQLRGNVWSAQVGPLSLTDPLAASESIAASKSVRWVLVASVIVPLLITLVLGRVFCSWICPMGLLLEMTDKLRSLLRFLEISPGNARAPRGIKYAVLLLGLGLSSALSVPVLSYIYPPAIISREAGAMVSASFDRAEIGRSGFPSEALTWMALIIVAIVVLELSVSRRWWCRYVCPGGALYSLIGWSRPLRVRLKSSNCTACAQCTAACPMGLNPMKDQMGIECDSCGVCISACNDQALDYALPLADHAASVRRHSASPDAQGARP